MRHSPLFAAFFGLDDAPDLCPARGIIRRRRLGQIHFRSGGDHARAMPGLMAAIAVLILLVEWCFWKELKIVAFDPDFARPAAARRQNRGRLRRCPGGDRH